MTRSMGHIDKLAIILLIYSCDTNADKGMVSWTLAHFYTDCVRCGIDVHSHKRCGSEVILRVVDMVGGQRGHNSNEW